MRELLAIIQPNFVVLFKIFSSMRSNQSWRHKSRTAVVVLGLCLVFSAGLIVHCRSSRLRQCEPGSNDGCDKVTNAITDSCTGATCALRSTCGEAPLNPLTGRNGSSLSPSPHYANYVINGEAQAYGEWPSYVKLHLFYYSRSARTKLAITCGGVLVSNKHILTAAHCLISPDDGERIDASDVVAIFGDHIIDRRDRYEKYARAESICLSSKFKYEVRGDIQHVLYDYAVLTLKTRMDFGRYYQPACLPYNKLEVSGKIPCYLLGGGAIGFDSRNNTIPAKTVMKVRVRHSSCTALDFYEDESRICLAKKDSDGGSCLGDSGGPVLCLDPKSKRWTVVGLVSYGPLDCKMADDEDSIFVATRLPSLLSDIKKDCNI